MNRTEEIRNKGFKMRLSNDTNEERPISDYAKMKVGLKSLEDAIISLGSLKKVNSRLADKAAVQRAINDYDLDTQREISNFFFRISGIYSRLVRHLSNFYRYDWTLTPYIVSSKVKNESVVNDFNKTLKYLDSFQAKRFLGNVAEKVLRNGVYYGYIIHNEDSAQVQELPPRYCRSRYVVNGEPAVEFNMAFFKDYYKDAEQRINILKSFPKDFQKGFSLYLEGKLKPEYPGDKAGWYLLDPNFTVKFNIGEDESPLFMSVIPHIIDLDEAQELDRKKMAQKLLKIIVQEMPFDKNGDLVFDIDEAADLHNNAVKMLGKSVGVDVLTTFANIDVIDLADNSSVTSIDELEKVERTVYNESGTAQNLFNTDGNIALEKSILDDEATLYNLILQFQSFLNKLIKPFNKNPKKLYFRVSILPTTIYNYKDMAKTYKEQAQYGYSKVMPVVALGQSQSEVLAMAHFENQILNLSEKLQPLQSSNTLSPDKKTDGDGEKEAGREELPDDQKSAKTIANREAMN